MTNFAEALNRLWPHGDEKIPGLRAGMIETAGRVFQKYGIVTPLQVAHVMAQFSHECGAGHEVVENLNYRAEQLWSQWSAHFTYAQSLAMQHQPQKIANQAYNGRMANRLGSDDGWNYRGRGAAQTTGREGYEKLARKTGLDLVNSPDLVNDPRHFLECAVADFVLCGCLPFCAPKPGLPDGDIRGVTHHLNGGYIGLAQRQAWFAKWKAALRSVPTPAPQPAPAPPDTDPTPAEVAAAEPDDIPADDGVLRYGRGHGAPDYEVRALQELLVSKGYQVGAIDGDFGGGLRAAVLAAQADNGLPTTGEVDSATKAAFKTMPAKPIAEARATATADDLAKAGSQTVVRGQGVSWWGKILATVGIGGGGAQQTGALDKVRDAADQISTFRSVVETVQDLGHWALQFWWVFAIAGGILALKYGGDIVKQRLADHRSAANTKF